MHSKPLLPALAIAALCVAACGSSGPRAAGASSSVSRTRPTRVYRVRLGGGAETPPGALLGQGDAIISFHGDSVICWRFAHLHGFTDATYAHIHAGTNGRSGAVVVALSTAPRLHHQGCISVSPTLGKAIISNPSGYYINIHSIRYPAGAVRAQL